MRLSLFICLSSLLSQSYLKSEVEICQFRACAVKIRNKTFSLTLMSILLSCLPCLQKGNTALHIASLAGRIDVVNLLIEHGAKVNIQSQVSLGHR